jgi:MFS family permease
MARLFDHPGYAKFWTADTISTFGTYISTVALPVLAIVTLRATDTEAGLVSGARYVPYVLFGLIAGVVADRYRRRNILIGMNLGRFVLLGLLASLVLTGFASVYVLMGFALILGTMSVFYEAADQSYLPRLVPPEALTQANARLYLSTNVAQTTGPFFGGAIIAAIGIPLSLLVDGFSYLASALLLSTIRRPEPVPPRAERNLRAELREGLAWVYRHRVLAPYALTLHIRFLFASGIAGTVFTLFVTRGLDSTLSEKEAGIRLGIVLAVGGVGAVVGNLLSRAAGRFGTGQIIVGARLFEPIGWAFAALAVSGTGGWVMVAASQFLVWMAMGVSGPHDMGYRQAVTPDRLQGRMNATIRSMNWGTIAIGAPLGGLLAQWIGYRPVFWVAITGMALSAIAAALSPLRTARHPEPALAPTV